VPPHLNGSRLPLGVFAGAVGLGIAYGLAFRWLFGRPDLDRVFGVMSVAFIFFVPFALGYLTVWAGERRGPWGWEHRLVAPMLTGLLALFSALLLAWEGWICIFLWLPLFLTLSLAGGVLAALAGILVRRWRGRAGLALTIALLPLVVAPIEHRLPAPVEIRTIETSIDVRASPATVWRHIARVERFEPGEHHFAWVHAIGFLRPVEATLSREGVGGVRHASFEGGVVFVETITDWQPDRRLAFSIAADPASIPARTLDEHVTVGGEFFDVLDGTYEIEPLAGDGGDGGVRLHLTSRHRVSTRFNFYARWWTDFILADTQRYILTVLRQRCERAELAAS
jgi:Polyketide cyclase / dehydrase and lipid transport